MGMLVMLRIVAPPRLVAVGMDMAGAVAVAVDVEMHLPADHVAQDIDTQERDHDADGKLEQCLHAFGQRHACNQHGTADEEQRNRVSGPPPGPAQDHAPARRALRAHGGDGGQMIRLQRMLHADQRTEQKKTPHLFFPVGSRRRAPRKHAHPLCHRKRSDERAKTAQALSSRPRCRVRLGPNTLPRYPPTRPQPALRERGRQAMTEAGTTHTFVSREIIEQAIREDWADLAILPFQPDTRSIEYLQQQGFEAAHIVRVTDHLSPDDLAVLCGAKAIKKLALPGHHIGDEGAKAIAGKLSGLTSLNLRGNSIGAEGAKAIAGKLTDLTSLDLGYNSIGDEGARAIAARLTGLTSLNLRGNRIGDEGAKAIAGKLTRLTSLNLEVNSIGDEGAKAIAGKLTGLTSLNLEVNSIGDEGAKAIAGKLTGLTSLNLKDNSIGAEGAAAIAGKLTGLTSLNLTGNSIGVEGAEAIADKLTGLTSLNLRHNRIGDEGAEAIAGKLTGLKSLDLSDNGIGAEGAKAIAGKLSGLTSLNLRYNRIGDEGARAIAGKLTGLTSLDLWDNSIGAEGARAIAGKLTSLTSLDLGWNSIGAEGAKAIAGKLTGLTSLDLGWNSIGAEGAKAIAGKLTGLTSLNLWDNSIGDEGARAIAGKLTGLTSLDLGGNRIGDEGARAIAGKLTGLTSLNLRHNSIGDEGAKAIAGNLTGLISLNLWNNSIGAAGARAILDCWLGRQDIGALRMLDLRGNGDLSAVLPKEVVEQTDAQAILAAYRRFKESRKKPLNEAKLLVLGDEAVGKTSLVRFLVWDRPRDPNEAKTAGVAMHERIETHAWRSAGGSSDVLLNIWDFGGQEIMHGTHRYFLTERSLYLIVLENRREDDRSVYGWLDRVKELGGDSPVLVVINKCDDDRQQLRLNEAELLRDHPHIAGFYRTSCNDSDDARKSIETLKEAIATTLETSPLLEHVKDPVPIAWHRVKNAVSVRAAAESVLPMETFRQLCHAGGSAEERVTDESEQRALLTTLHNMGKIVAHGLKHDDRAAFREITLLDPNWLTTAIYTILNSGLLKDQKGELARGDLCRLLDPVRYPPKRHDFILEMMQDKEIGLCFRLPEQDERYLLPEGLPVERAFTGKLARRNTSFSLSLQEPARLAHAAVYR